MGYTFNDEIELPFLDDADRPDPRFDGLEVYARSVDLDTWMAYQDVCGDGMTPVPRNREAYTAAAEIVAPTLIRWNLTAPDGNPVPCELDALRTRPKPLLIAILNAWARGQMEITPDFGDGSADGSPTAPIPMQSQAS